MIRIVPRIFGRKPPAPDGPARIAKGFRSLACRAPLALAISLIPMVSLLVLASDDASDKSAAAGTRVEFNRDVRPILSNNCLKCHGLDERARKAGLRLDVREQATRPSELGGTAIVPGRPNESELVRRIFATRHDEVMPPPETNQTLSPREKELLKRWIEQGAEYQPHWSFIPPTRPNPPPVRDERWPRNDLDRFVLARLEADQLRPSPEADRATLIRRVTFDLTGLPPTLAEIDAFLADSSDDAYDKVVDRLLASPRFGERMAVDWLDAARFADTHGYHIDSGRDMTHWREWVINAFNRNLPFDQFTIDQIAGDLVPGATIEQRIASGFHRNHMINFEGGAIPEEYHVAYIVDRVNTTGTVWLGLSLGCAQCHEHKYDPISQAEYYGLYAFFHNVPENGLDGRAGNAVPVLKLPTAEQQRRLDSLAASICELDERLAGPIAEVDAAQAEWERATVSAKQVEWTPLDAQKFTAKGGATLTKLDDKSILASGPNPPRETYTVIAATDLSEITAIRLEALPDDSLAAKGPGRSTNGNIMLTGVHVSVGPLAGAEDGTPAAVKLKAASADFSQKDFPIAQAIDDKPETGWAIHPEVGKAHAAVFEFDQPIALSAQKGSGVFSQVGAVISSTEATRDDGDPRKDSRPRLLLPRLLLTITLDFQSSYAQHQLGRFRLSVTGSKEPHESQRPPAKIQEILAVEPDKRSDAQRAELRKHYRANLSPITKQLNDQLAKLRKEQTDLDKQVPTTMVMQEMDKPRDTFMLIRGQYDKKGEKVAAGVPSSLGRLPDGAPPNRLGLARWLVDPSQPLTARVIVNRFWQMYFGTGLVKTAEDFGSQGEWPSHPELLDWLACEFVGFECGESRVESQSCESLGSVSGPRLSALDSRRSTWDIKHIQRLIVTSATYRQSSAVTPALANRDPENRLLARGPRHRLQVEFIRDQALAISGLLNPKIGGASVSPYQPPGIWEELAYRADGKNFTAQEYVQSHGPDLYRRTMYTFIKRTAPPPTLVTFDAPDRETCTVRRPRTNTPLQALVLMNDPTYIEAARKLAERILTEPGPAASREDRIIFAFRIATARPPSLDELRLLRRLFDQQLTAFRNNPQAATKLLAVGESPRDDSHDAAELAAWTIVANVLLNLDETVTKG
jgi:hypothetical protein